MRYFISQPMSGKTTETILSEREQVKAEIKKYSKNAEILDSFFPELNPEQGAQPLLYLSKALEVMADADIVVFAKGYNQSKGCRLEYLCAKEYGKSIWILDGE